MAKAPKEIIAIDEADVAKNIDKIVSLLVSIDSSKELVSSTLKYLKDTYGLNSTNVRAAAVAIKDEKVEELENKHNEISSLITICIS